MLLLVFDLGPLQVGAPAPVERPLRDLRHDVRHLLAQQSSHRRILLQREPILLEELVSVGTRHEQQLADPRSAAREAGSPLPRAEQRSPVQTRRASLELALLLREILRELREVVPSFVELRLLVFDELELRPKRNYRPSEALFPTPEICGRFSVYRDRLFESAAARVEIAPLSRKRRGMLVQLCGLNDEVPDPCRARAKVTYGGIGPMLDALDVRPFSVVRSGCRLGEAFFHPALYLTSGRTPSTAARLWRSDVER